MKTSNIKINLLNGSARAFNTNRGSGETSYEAMFGIKMNEEQWKALATFLDKESKEWEFTDHLGGFKIIKVKIRAGIGYSVWKWFFGDFLKGINTRMNHTEGVNFRGLSI